MLTTQPRSQRRHRLALVLGCALLAVATTLDGASVGLNRASGRGG